MIYRVFAQAQNGRVNLAQLVQNARMHFEASVEVLQQEGLVEDATEALTSEARPWVRLRLSSVRRGFSAILRVTCRSATSEDWEGAQRAERNGRAAGMGLLAARCGAVWDVEPEGEPSVPALLNLCALLASVALGPVLPPDEETLFGIRGAMERLDALTGRSLAR
ncbi:MAG TPA: hypothetical protein VIM73_05075 [Polyangiaceae bacterium]